jgi:hypothetical protein
VARTFWRLFFPFLYRFLRVTDPFWRRLAERRGLVNTVELLVVGRRTGLERRVLLGLVAVDERRYVGHANAERIVPGPEQDTVVRAASRQHPFPVDIAYRLARASIRVDGLFVRLEAADGTPVPLPARARRD